MSRTKFRPELDGFAFRNSWQYDSEELQQLHNIMIQALPVAEAIISPLLGVVAGPALALESALAGPFAPVLLYYQLKAINDTVTNAIINAIAPGHYGRCGGMAFASLDYWLLNWVIPRGLGPDDAPTRDTPQALELRNYILQRLLDSVRDNAVTFLSWSMMLQIPYAGASWLRDRSREQFQIIRSQIDNTGCPVPIGLVGTTLNPFNNHQVLCYGYEDFGNDTGRLILYDNNHPDQESRIDFDFSSSALCTTWDDTASTDRGELRGFFATVYSPAIPPKALVLTQSITTHPTAMVEKDQPLEVTYEVQNVGFRRSANVALKVISSDSMSGGEVSLTPLEEGATRMVSAQLRFNNTGMKTLAVIADLGEVASNSIFKQLPAADDTQIGSMQINVIPGLVIHASSNGGNASAIAGQITAFTADSPGTSSNVVSWEWAITNATGYANTGSRFRALMPSTVGAAVTVSVRVTFRDGSVRTGTLTLTTVAAAIIELRESLQQLYTNLYPHRTLPDPTPEGFFTRTNIVQLQKSAEQLLDSIKTAFPTIENTDVFQMSKGVELAKSDKLPAESRILEKTLKNTSSATVDIVKNGKNKKQ